MSFEKTLSKGILKSFIWSTERTNMNCKGIFFILLFLFYAPTAFSISQHEGVLQELSYAIENRESYIQEKQDKIDRLQHVLKQNDISLLQQFKVLNKLHKEYRTFQYDSAFTYALKLHETAKQLHDPARVTYAKLKMSLTLLSSGMFKEALDSLNTVNTKFMPDSIKVQYYDLKSRAYYDLASFNVDTYYTPRYIKAGMSYADSALSLLNENTLLFYSLRGGKYERSQEFEKAVADYKTILNKFNPSLNQYAMTANTLANIYYAQGNTDKAIETMAKAAIADVKASVKEGVALMTLANYLYETGDEVRAYNYIKQALEDADFYGAKQRKIQVAAILPLIEGERLATVESQRSSLFIYAIVVSLLSLLVVIFAFIILKQLRQLREAKTTVTGANTQLQEANNKLKEINDKLQETNDELIEANKIKEEYIGYSFNMYSEYVGKIEKLKRSIDRKLMSRKYDEISHVVESINLKKEREALYQSFDRIFLKLFPNFVPVFNSFFKDEDKIVLKDDHTLSIELRIFALIRMGIHDHEQIAKILEYSVRTIYNYKTRVKNRSFISNEDFERKIMEIKAF